MELLSFIRLRIINYEPVVKQKLTFIFHISGTDNSRITYTIVKTNTPVANFTIDPATGTFKPVKAIDFEELAAFQDDESIKPVRAVQVLVRATDHGSPPLSSDVVVTVYIQDTNDHAPVFDRSSYGAAIPEDLASGTSVLQVCFQILQK